MGLTVECHCEHCGYRFWGPEGSGMLYPLVYKKTIEDIRNGKYGNQAMEFFKVFPDGAIDAQYVVIQCEHCRGLDSVPDLTLYVKNEIIEKPSKRIKSKHKKIEKTIRYKPKQTKSAWDEIPIIRGPGTEYIEFEKYKHICKYCGGSTYKIDLDLEMPIPMIPCPGCEHKVKIYFIEQWD